MPMDIIEEQQQLLTTHRRTLAYHLHRLALVGEAHAPPEIMHGLSEARDAIQRIKEKLRGWGITVDDYPDDVDPISINEAGTPPFRGLLHFDETDAELFFGREELTEKLVRQLVTQQRLLIVVGASGSGKSSIIRAGLIPALRRGVLLAGNFSRGDTTRWIIHVITPDQHPLESLAASLTRNAESVTATTTLIDDLAHDPRSLHLFAHKSVHQQNSKNSRLLLVIDQFEEVFTLCEDRTERRAFIDNLLKAVAPDTNSAISIIIILRADFYAHCAQFAELRAALEHHQTYLGAMTPSELRRAIQVPAQRTGWEFEPGLVELLLQEVGDEAGTLPLLSHTLLETWQRRRGRVMTLEGYTAAGGIRGAIAQTAEKVYNTLSSEQQLIAHTIFLRLTELGEGTQDTRRRIALTELLPIIDGDPEIQLVLKTLTDARLITTDKLKIPGYDRVFNEDIETIEVSHEALIREWPRLREWLDQDREGLRVHRRLTEASQEWARLNDDESLLYRGSQLNTAQEWATTYTGHVNELEQKFLLASRAAVDRVLAERERVTAEKEAQQQRELTQTRALVQEQQRIQRRIIWLFLSLALIIGLLVSTATFWFITGTEQARLDNQLAEAARVTGDGFVNLEKNNLQFLHEMAFTGANSAVGAPAINEALANRDQLGLEKAIDPYFRVSVQREGIRADRMIVFDSTGTSLLDWERIPDANGGRKVTRPARDLSALWFVQRITSGGRDVYGDKYAGLFDPRDSDTNYLFSVAPVVRSDNTVVGGIIIASRLDSALQTLQSESLAAIITVYQANDGSAFISTQAAPGSSALAALNMRSDIVSAVRNPLLMQQHSVFDIKRVNERDYQFAYAPLRIRNSLIGLISVALYREYVTGSVSNVRPYFIGLAIVLVLCISGVGSGAAWLLTRPLKALSGNLTLSTDNARRRRLTTMMMIIGEIFLVSFLIVVAGRIALYSVAPYGTLYPQSSISNLHADYQPWNKNSSQPASP